jgi:hypothetical protein
MKKVILAIAILSLGIAEANAACNSATLKGAYITDSSLDYATATLAKPNRMVAG